MLLTGPSPLEADEMLQMIESKEPNQWLEMPPRALDFVRGLLNQNPKERMTATQALFHEWFTKPFHEAAEMEEGYKRMLWYWGKREEDEVIERIPDRPWHPSLDQDFRSSTTLREKVQGLPDAPPYPYVSLDRYTNPRAPAMRGKLLEALNEKGISFVPPSESRLRRRSSVKITMAEGIDLFGTALAQDGMLGIKVQPELGEVDLLTTVAPPMEKVFGFRPSKYSHPQSSFQSDLSQFAHKRARRGSENSDERELHDAARKEESPWRMAKR